jgi:transcriptional regulator with XRE-family HTH domain
VGVNTATGPLYGSSVDTVGLGVHSQTQEEDPVPNIEAGERIEKVVRVALARSPRLHTVADLLRETGLHPNTLYDIFAGKVESPSPQTIARIAKALDMPMAHLWDAWQGREPEPDSIEAALRQHTEAVGEQNRLLTALVGFIRSAAGAVVAPDQEEAAEGQARGEVADEVLQSRGDNGSHATPPAPHGTEE